MQPQNNLMRVASSNNVPALASGDVAETKRWLGKQIRLIREDIRRCEPEQKAVFEAMLKIFKRELIDMS